MKKTLVWPLLFLIAACESNSDYVRKHEWKYGHGHHIGDWLSFAPPTSFRIAHDTIYWRDTARAVVTEVNKRVGADNKLILRDVATDNTGTYFGK
ncbi:MAG: hypothetical protein MUC87_00615 [Bacteroidia bacterium]|nr:hypothetical protein [Bacteroidia bacterium]